jgi:hemolysin III
MTETQTAENYTPLEEIFNSLTHGIGILISLAGMVLMIVFASRYGNVNHIVSCTIFGLTLVMLYTASTLYHSFRKPTLKHVFKICDHSCIYLLIAGTYTPFLMVTLKACWAGACLRWSGR